METLRPRPREVLVLAAVLGAFFWTPHRAAPDLRALAQRDFDERDVVLLGFDSVSGRDAEPVLAGFSPSRGGKVVFTNASTPVPLTSTAWRSLLSGQVPTRDLALPGAVWPRDRSLWLPAQLEERGYRPAFAQDDPATNTYGAGESIRVMQSQGWHSAFTEFAWGLAFPLSSAGGRWWVGALGGPEMDPGQQAYCAACFMDEALARMALEARRGPVFWAVHTCYAHAPTFLTLTEAARIPGWWKRPPRALIGSGNPLFDAVAFGASDVAAARMASVRELLRRTLLELDASGVLGRASVFVFSDHGPRGRTVPPEETEHVMLAAFLPGERRDLSVDQPVLLTDLAPTIRAQLGIASRETDGRPLPLDGRPRQLPPRPPLLTVAHLASFGVDLWHADPAKVAQTITFHPDGTFSVDAARVAALLGAPEAGATVHQ